MAPARFLLAPALSKKPLEYHATEAMRVAIVAGSALALILAERALPF
jgi:hypothetical protein